MPVETATSGVAVAALLANIGSFSRVTSNVDDKIRMVGKYTGTMRTLYNLCTLQQEKVVA